MEGKWIKFVEVLNTKKITKTYWVINKQSEFRLGTIKWYGPFRQYSFLPEANTVFEQQCLLDITKFIHKLMLERKLKNQLRKAE